MPSIVRSTLRLFLQAGWAPAAVLLFHAAIAKTPLRTPLDFTMHFLGGMAIASFFHHALDCYAPAIGQLTKAGRLLFAFALACTTGVFWEFAEYWSDVLRHTHIQQSLRETLSDLHADAGGAALALLLIAVCGFLKRQPGNP